MTDEPLDREDKREPSALDDAELLSRLKAWFKESRDNTHDWRGDAQEDYAFVAGDQWNEDDLAKLREQLRPVVTFNRVGPVIDAVSGMEVNNRQEVRYIPRTEGDGGVNELLTGAAQWVRDETDAEDEESDSFVDMLISGMGWTETRMDYDTDPDGMVVIERIDPLEMYWDVTSRRRNLDGARFVFRVKEMAWPEARAMFPDAEDEQLHASWAKSVYDSDEAHDRESARQYASGEVDEPRSKLCRIVESQWFEREDYYRVVVTDPMSGEQKQLEASVSEWKKYKERAAEIGLPIEGTKQKRKVFKRAFIGAEILESGDAPCPYGFSYRCMTGKRDRNKGTWYGLVRGMKDPQRWANKFFSNLMHTMASAGKGIIAESDTFEDWRQAETDWARPDKIVKAKPGSVAGQKIMPKPPSQLPPGLDKLLEFSLLSIRDGTGVNTEMMGAADREQAGVLEYQRKQSAMTILASLFDSLRRYRKEQGRILLHFITEYMSDGRLIRIVGEEGQQYVPLVRHDDTVKYDVIVDDAPASPNQKEATWAILGGLMPMLMKMPLPSELWAEIVKASPLPNSFAEKIDKMIREQAQQPPPPDPNQMKAEAQVQVMQQKAQIDAQKSQADMQIEQMRLQMEMQAEQQRLQMEAAAERQRLQFEQIKAMLEMQQDRERHQQDMRQASQKAGLDMRVQQAKGQVAIEGAKESAKVKNQIAKQAARNKPKAA